jgi:2-keto-4-pentenoate hydratase
MTANQELLDAFTQEMFGVVRQHRLDRVTNVEVRTLSLSEAYEVQSQVLVRRIREGEQKVGWKIGCTSRAIQEQFGLSQPISGRLMEPHIHHDGVVLPAGDFAYCAVEPEMVFRLRKDLSPGADEKAAADAIASVAAGIEFHNFHFWYGTPTSQELIGSNGIHAGLVMNEERSFKSQFDLSMEGVGIWVNNQLEASGIGAEIMGGPVESLCWLARHASKRGETIRRGELIIPGSAVKLVRVKPGDKIEARFTHLGTCRATLS